jgi:hypothetical protein
MSKIVATTITALLVLPLLASPSFAAKNIGVHGGGGLSNSLSQCTTISVPEWHCPPGDSPSNWPNTNCKLVMVDKQVCHIS